MKNEQGYPFTTNAERIRYEFVSIEPKVNIAKVVEFSNLKFAYNLAFGDLMQS